MPPLLSLEKQIQPQEKRKKKKSIKILAGTTNLPKL